MRVTINCIQIYEYFGLLAIVSYEHLRQLKLYFLSGFMQYTIMSNFITS